MSPTNANTCTPELAAFLAARDRVQAALDAQAATLAKLKQLDVLNVERAAERAQRRPTLIGVAPQAGTTRPFTVAAGLGRRPNGRY